MHEIVPSQKQEASKGGDRLNLHEKLLEIQISVDKFIKDGQNTSDKYSFVSSDMVLENIRPKMNELRLLLIPNVRNHMLHEGATKSGTVRFFTEMELEFVWIDVESGDKMTVPFYAQGVDLAGEKGVGKALTYAEKYFLMKFFHVPTSKDDPDSDGRTKSGEKKQRGTQAAKENSEYYVKSVAAMLDELCGGDAEKIRQSIVSFTRNKTRGYEGTDDIMKVSDLALPVLYAKVKQVYREKTGHDFELKEAQADAD